MTRQSKIIQLNNANVRKKIQPKEKRFTASQLLNISIFLTIGFVFTCVYFYSFDYKLDLNGDNASYYLLGKSICLGEGYNLYNDLGAKSHNHFPPGYPLLISILMLFSKSPVFIKLANGGFLLGSFLLSYRVFRKFQVTWQVALVSILLMCFNYHLLKSSVIIMSEIPFLFFSLLSFLLLMQVDFSKAFYKDKYFYFLLLSLSFSFHIRTVGIALFAGILFYLLLERRWKGSLAVLIGFTTLALPWILRGKILGLSNSYQKQLLSINPYRAELGEAGLMDLLTRFGENFVRYFTKEIPSGLLPFLEINYKETQGWSEWFIGSLLIVLVILGIYKLPKYRSLILGYLGGSFVILMLWPKVWFGTRFLLPLLPFLMFLVVYAASWLLNQGLRFLKLETKYAPFVLLFFLFSFVQPFKPHLTDTNWQEYPLTRLAKESKRKPSSKWENYYKIAEYVKENLPSTAIIACRKPQLFHIASDRFTCNYPFIEDDKKLLQILKEKKVKYVVIDQLGYSSTASYLAPAINKNSYRFRKILEIKNPNTYLLEFLY